MFICLTYCLQLRLEKVGDRFLSGEW